MAHGLHQLAQGQLHLIGVGDIKVNQSHDQSGKGADDADAGEDAGYMFVKVHLQRGVHQGVLRIEQFSGTGGLPLPCQLLWVGFELGHVVKCQAVFLPEFAQVGMALCHVLQIGQVTLLAIGQVVHF